MAYMSKHGIPPGERGITLRTCNRVGRFTAVLLVTRKVTSVIDLDAACGTGSRVSDGHFCSALFRCCPHSELQIRTDEAQWSVLYTFKTVIIIINYHNYLPYCVVRLPQGHLVYPQGPFLLMDFELRLFRVSLRKNGTTHAWWSGDTFYHPTRMIPLRCIRFGLQLNEFQSKVVLRMRSV